MQTSPAQKMKTKKNIDKIKQNIKKAGFLQYNYTKLKIVRDSFSFQKQQAKYFIVICRTRSGTTCFLDLLSSHSQVFTNPHDFFTYDRLPLDFQKTEYVNSHKNVLGFKFLTQLYGKEQNESNIKLAQERLNTLTEQGVKIFYLKRDNLLKRSVSKVVAEIRQGNINHYRQQGKLPQKNYELSPTKIIQALKEADDQATFDREVMAKVPHVFIEYERDLENQHSHQKTLDKCCEALEIDSVKARTNLVKLTPKKFESYITNWNEISEVIANSKYQSYLI